MTCHVVLLAADGLRNDIIASRLSLQRQIVSKWRKRFFYQRLPGLHEEPRGGRTPAFPPSVLVRHNTQLHVHLPM